MRPTANELSVNLEREIKSGLSGRASYVYKNQRNLWGEYDTIRGPLYTVPFTINDPGPDNNLATLEDNQTLQTFDRPAGALPQDRVFTNVDDADADFHTIEFAVNRRFNDNWMLLTSGGMTWATMLHEETGYQQLLNAVVNTANQNYLPGRRIFGDNGNETSTTWNYKVIGRYVMPWEIGLSGSWRFQSGQNYGRTLGINFPGDGNRTFRVEPIDARRYPNMSILDFRLDKALHVRPLREAHRPVRHLQHPELRRADGVPADERELPRGDGDSRAARHAVWRAVRLLRPVAGLRQAFSRAVGRMGRTTSGGPALFVCPRTQRSRRPASARRSIRRRQSVINVQRLSDGST